MTWNDPIVLALVAATPVVVGIVVAYKRAGREAKKAEGAQTIEHTIGGLSKLAENLQKDNESLRDQLSELKGLPGEVENLKKKIAELEKVVGVLKGRLANK